MTDYTTLKALAEAANRPMSEIGLMEHKRAAMKAMHDALLPDDVLALLADLDALRTRVAELEKDAARYQVLRDEKYQQQEDDVSVSDSYFNVFFGEELDDAVDVLAARYAATGAQA